MVNICQYTYLQRGEHVTRQICRLRHLVKRGKAFSYPARVPWRILLLATTDQQLWNILDRLGTHTTHVWHVGLSTSINDILFNYVCVFGPQMIVLRIEL